MSATKKIPFVVAVLICVNSMIGAGLFINPKPLTEIAGPLGFMGYVFSALIFLPIILSVATLAQLHPVAGGLYVYAKTYINAGAGFLSGWSYFIGKTTTTALLMHKVVEFFQQVSPWLASFSTLSIDYILILFFILLNIAGMHVGGKVQYLFTTLKAIPIIFAFIIGFLSFNPSFFTVNATNISNSIMTVSIAAFAMLGFEVICAVGHLIEDSERQIKKVIISAFLIVASINILFQVCIFGALGNSLAILNTPILALGLQALPTMPFLGNIINGIVFAAILGAFFSILTSNAWNLYTLAKNNHIPGSSWITKLSQTNVPWVSLFIEGALGCLIITISHNQRALQNMSVFSQTISLLLSVFAAYITTTHVTNAKLNRLIPLLGIASCGFILSLSFFNILKSGVSLPFLAIFLAGIVAALIQKMKKSA